MDLKSLLIELALEHGFVECSGAIRPPEHYADSNAKKSVMFIKAGFPVLSGVRMFFVSETKIKYVGEGDVITDMDVTDPASLDKFQTILENGNGRSN